MNAATTTTALTVAAHAARRWATSIVDVTQRP
jgi:hypothetical protein